MKALAIISTAAILSGCALGSGGIGPSDIPKNAYGAFWTSKPLSQVSACLNSAGLTPTYQAQDISGQQTAYRTLVVLTVAEEQTQTSREVHRCVDTNPVTS